MALATGTAPVLINSALAQGLRLLGRVGAAGRGSSAAALAALSIADELHSTQRDLGENSELIREQADRCLMLVERALKQTA